jgi:Cd2+/Zn2+-exporting ATPase
VLQQVGSQATVDAASAVLAGNLGELPAAIVVARRTAWLVTANVVLSLALNAAVIVAAATVGLPLWLSVVADNGGLLLVLLNSTWPMCWRVPPVDAMPARMRRALEKRQAAERAGKAV